MRAVPEACSPNTFRRLATVAGLRAFEVIGEGGQEPDAENAGAGIWLRFTKEKEVFEAQTFSNFFRFPMLFLCGLFFPIAALPVFLRPLSFLLPLTYGADPLHGAVPRTAQMPTPVSMAILAGFCTVLFLASLRNVRRKWIM